MKKTNQEIDKKGRLFALEGIDGAGKKTWRRFLENWFVTNGFKARSLEYPDYSSPWGNIIKKYLNDEIELDPTEQFFTYFTDIFKDQEKIRNLLSQGIFVIIDRYFPSTIAFQCAKGFSYELAFDILKAAKPLVPDVIFFIDVQSETAIERCSYIKRLDRHERDLGLLRSVAQLYKRIIQERMLARKWIVVDGNKDLDTLKRIMEKELSTIINEWKASADVDPYTLKLMNK